MYEKHKMETVLFDSVDVFTIGLASDADEDGGGSGKYSWGPDRSDS